MRAKRQIIQELMLSQNYRLAMSMDNLTFKELAKKSGVSENTAFRMVSRTPVFITPQLVKVGKSLGFSEREIREKSRLERKEKRITYSKKSRFFELISELVDLFETKTGK